MDIAMDIQKHIPDSLLLTTDTIKRFGCPDCTDGGGIYLQIQQGSIVKKINIDAQTEVLHGNMKAFAIYLLNKINQINKP